MKARSRLWFTPAVVAGSTLLALYGLEALAAVAPSRWLDKLGTTLRPGPTVVAETHRLRQRRIEAYPFLQADLFTNSAQRGLRVGDTATAIPLAGIPDELTVLCNESGTTIAYRADGLGFRNPAGAWRSPHAALVGDSFTHGFCRPDEETVAGVMRGRGIPVVNAGVTGAGPLTTLGIVREYVSRSQPRVVYWLVYEGNDLIDLATELGTAMSKYRSPSFTQRLADRKDVGTALKRFGDSVVAAYQPPGFADRAAGFLTLRRLRLATGVSGARRPPGIRDEERELVLLEETLGLAKQDIESWNGELRLVYLPERRRFNESPPVIGENHDFDAVHDGVIAIANELLLPVIDGAKLFAAQQDPARLWNNRRYHYNAAGYRVIADAIAADLARAAPLAAGTPYTNTLVER